MVLAGVGSSLRKVSGKCLVPPELSGEEGMEELNACSFVLRLDEFQWGLFLLAKCLVVVMAYEIAGDFVESFRLSIWDTSFSVGLFHGCSCCVNVFQVWC